MSDPGAMPTLKLEVARPCSVRRNQVETTRVETGQHRSLSYS